MTDLEGFLFTLTLSRGGRGDLYIVYRLDAGVVILKAGLRGIY